MKRGLAIIFFLSLIGIVSASSGTYIGDFYVDLEITISILLFLSFFWFTNFIFRKSAFNEVSKVIISLCFSLGMLWGVLKLELTISISDFLTNLGLSDIILSAAPWIIIGFLILGWIKFGFGSTLFFVGIGFFIFGWIGHLLDIVYRWQFLMIVGGIIGFIGFLIMKKKLGKVLKGVGKGAWKAAKWTGKQAVGGVGTGLDAQIEKNKTKKKFIDRINKDLKYVMRLLDDKNFHRAKKLLEKIRKLLKRKRLFIDIGWYNYWMRFIQELEERFWDRDISSKQEKESSTQQFALPPAQPLALESGDMRRQREMKERIKKNIAKSKNARESSNFKNYAERERKILKKLNLGIKIIEKGIEKERKKAKKDIEKGKKIYPESYVKGLLTQIKNLKKLLEKEYNKIDTVNANKYNIIINILEDNTNSIFQEIKNFIETN